MNTEEIRPGSRIRVHQEIARREGNWEHDVVGVVVSCEPESSGSWHAHGKDDKFWINRIRLRKDDGELTTVVVDRHTRVEIEAETEES